MPSVSEGGNDKNVNNPFFPKPEEYQEVAIVNQTITIPKDSKGILIQGNRVQQIIPEVGAENHQLVMVRAAPGYNTLIISQGVKMNTIYGTRDIYLRSQSNDFTILYPIDGQFYELLRGRYAD